MTGYTPKSSSKKSYQYQIHWNRIKSLLLLKFGGTMKIKLSQNKTDIFHSTYTFWSQRVSQERLL